MGNGRRLPFYLAYVLVGVLALACRVFIAFGAGLSHYSTDSDHYLKVAERILSLSQWEVPLHPPGYSIFIALADLLGPRDLVVLWGQVLMSTAVAMIASMLIWRLTKRHLIAISGFLAIALWPNQLNGVRLLLSEVLACFLLSASLGLLLLGRNRAIWWAAVSGILLGFAVLTEPRSHLALFPFSVVACSAEKTDEVFSVPDLCSQDLSLPFHRLWP